MEQFPAYRKSPVFERLRKDPVRGVFYRILSHAKHVRTLMPVQGYYMEQLDRAVQEVLYGGASPAKALDQVRSVGYSTPSGGCGRTGSPRGRGGEVRPKTLTGLAFCSPLIFGLVAFTILPVLASLWFSLCNYPILDPPRYIGFANYTDLVKDEQFWHSVRNTFEYVLGGGSSWHGGGSWLGPSAESEGGGDQGLSNSFLFADGCPAGGQLGALDSLAQPPARPYQLFSEGDSPAGELDARLACGRALGNAGADSYVALGSGRGGGDSLRCGLAGCACRALRSGRTRWGRAVAAV